MSRIKLLGTRRSRIEIIVVLFCIAVTLGVISVLLFAYRPNQNSLGALGTVCMDVISIVILIILSLSLTFEKGGISRTTKLFLALMIATVYALFFDFLNWSCDGSLEFGDRTYIYTCCSLVMGSVLAGIFVCYLASYMDEMYNMTAQYTITKMCVSVNAISFIVTVILAITKNAFVYVDGHYQTGALYDIVTVLPVMTLVLMAVYAIGHIKTIGVHDFIAVIGYISIMISGATIESAYSIGATYVSVTIADVFIYVMLQGKLLNRVKQQKEMLAEKITSQYQILNSMAGIYTYVNYVDIENRGVKKFNSDDNISETLDLKGNPHSSLNLRLYTGVDPEYKEKFWAYTDLSTLSDRMSNEKIISSEFHHKNEGWFRAQYIRIGESTEGPIKRVIYAVRNIDEEKKNVEKWIQKSNTDELTGLFNRHAYEDEIAAIDENKLNNNFVYVSIDVNGLKIVNDSLGHEAGDELLVGACECMKQCLGAYGKLFRTGGDEFVALIYADDAQLEEIKKDLDEVTENWSGKLNNQLAISCGYVTKREVEGMSINTMAVLADKRMYEAKTRYYQKKGIDRRGQRDAHVALCALYTKILKINITDDTYQIINMNADEQTKDKGFDDKISTWLTNFGTSGQVHPEDLEKYLAQTKLESISEYFRNNKSSLSIFYRRKYSDGYKQVMMEMIPANDYSDEVQNLFLYVKNIE